MPSPWRNEAAFIPKYYILHIQVNIVHKVSYPIADRWLEGLSEKRWAPTYSLE